MPTTIAGADGVHHPFAIVDEPPAQRGYRQRTVLKSEALPHGLKRIQPLQSVAQFLGKLGRVVGDGVSVNDMHQPSGEVGALRARQQPHRHHSCLAYTGGDLDGGGELPP